MEQSGESQQRQKVHQLPLESSKKEQLDQIETKGREKQRKGCWREMWCTQQEMRSQKKNIEEDHMEVKEDK